jgi:hypothetical protein
MPKWPSDIAKVVHSDGDMVADAIVEQRLRTFTRYLSRRAG